MCRKNNNNDINGKKLNNMLNYRQEINRFFDKKYQKALLSSTKKVIIINIFGA